MNFEMIILFFLLTDKILVNEEKKKMCSFFTACNLEIYTEQLIFTKCWIHLVVCNTVMTSPGCQPSLLKNIGVYIGIFF